MSDHELDALIQRADLDGLVRLIDSLCTSRAWARLAEVRNRSRTAVLTGRQLWPAATLAEYRLTLWAPAEWAATVLDETSGRFAIGPLTEVVAQTHSFSELRDHLDADHRAGLVAQERSLRGEAIDNDVLNPLDIPFALQPWEPNYALAEYGDDGVDAPAPPISNASEFRHVMIHDEPRVSDDPEFTLAVRQLFDGWTAASTGRVDLACVEGGAAEAVAALGVRQMRLTPISPADALAWLAWAGASGAAQGRRRGAAIGRFGAWALAAAMCDVEIEDVGSAVDSVTWFWWSVGDPMLGWQVQLAAESAADGYAWVISAHDAA